VVVLKATWLDYVLSTLVITLLLVLSVLVVVAALPLTRHWCGDYHVLVDLALGLLSYGVLTALLLRLMLRIKPMVPGRYADDSAGFTYWKLLTVTYRLGQGALRPFVPVFLQPVVEMLYGCRMGADVALGGVIDDPYMVTVGDGTALGTASMVCGSYIADGVLTCGPVHIGRRVTIGPNVVVFPGTEIGDGAVLMVGAYVMPGTKVPAGETWRGNPARKWVQPAGKPGIATD
jgi:serine acetyltransferase